jgi:hypothetical protein
MPRKPLTKTAENTTQAIANALSTPLNLEWDATAESLDLTIPELQERMAAKLDETVFTWANIPAEHQPVVDAVARDLDAENSVRRLDAPTEPAQLSPVVENIPELPEEPQPKQSKRKSSALTERKTKTLEKATKDAERLDTGIVKAEQLLRAQKGAKAGAKLATIELLAEESAYNQVKGAALKRKVAALVNELAEEENFDPDELLKEVGLDSIPDTLQNLMEEIAPALGKLDEGTQEVIQTSWVNGLHIDLSHLESLLNSKD